ncbi:hypothetical protein H257_09513 [Aphanomyces astaci]|uniref:Uncharacterized protein n=1 Tax=Aphanomyces astaci TaxID=112090 RepID=W4GC17_APHAT|nr:hypothetical protein H257_09513 [Aphanomyces astaci]ETV76503.1 hypothetical protein H257_09513 [Aphanomyces astaci]|eukprot:XP_009834048.1 hypothetical protein H257_09513 [Aphanomyces astaci]
MTSEEPLHGAQISRWNRQSRMEPFAVHQEVLVDDNGRGIEHVLPAERIGGHHAPPPPVYHVVDSKYQHQVAQEKTHERWKAPHVPAGLELDINRLEVFARRQDVSPHRVAILNVLCAEQHGAHRRVDPRDGAKVEAAHDDVGAVRPMLAHDMADALDEFEQPQVEPQPSDR